MDKFDLNVDRSFQKVKCEGAKSVRFIGDLSGVNSPLDMKSAVLVCLVGLSHAAGDVMKMVDSEWIDQFVPRTYTKNKNDDTKDPYNSDVSKDNNYGYSDQGMKDLDEVGGLVGGGDSDLLGILRPYYSMVEMSANGNKQGMGSYLHVLPDSSEGDEPVYSVGGSFFGGIEPAGAKIGYMNRPFGK